MCVQSNVVKFISSNALIFRITSWLEPRSKLDIVDCWRCKEENMPLFPPPPPLGDPAVGFCEFSLESV